MDSIFEPRFNSYADCIHLFLFFFVHVVVVAVVQLNARNYVCMTMIVLWYHFAIATRLPILLFLLVLWNAVIFFFIFKVKTNAELNPNRAIESNKNPIFFVFFLVHLLDFQISAHLQELLPAISFCIFGLIE